MSSEQERLDRFDRAMTRLMQAHQDALEACRGVLDDRDEHPAGDDVGYIPEASTLLDTFAPPWMTPLRDRRRDDYIGWRSKMSRRSS